MTIVSNTGPLIALAKIERLSLLRDLGWDTVLIPTRVHRELWGRIGPESDAIATALNAFIRAVKAPPEADAMRSAVEGLDEGEQEVLALPASRRASPLALEQGLQQGEAAVLVRWVGEGPPRGLFVDGEPCRRG